MILIIGDYNESNETHKATDAAIAHSGAALGRKIHTEWVPPSKFDDPGRLEMVRSANGIVVAPGSPYSSLRGTLDAIEIARTEYIPLLGTCGGFQHVVLEFARNELGFRDAQHAEYDPYGSRLIISKLACTLFGRKLSITLEPESQTAKIYRSSTVEESYYCNFGVNPEYVPKFRGSDLQNVGSDAEGEIRIVELEDHPFFIATLFIPQMRSTPEKPHPLVTAFLRAVIKKNV